MALPPEEDVLQDFDHLFTYHADNDILTRGKYIRLWLVQITSVYICVWLIMSNLIILYYLCGVVVSMHVTEYVGPGFDPPTR